MRTYITQEVVVPQEPEEEHPVEGSLIDTSEVLEFSDNHSRNSNSPNPMQLEIIAERDFLRAQCEKLGFEFVFN